uniref:U91-Liphistoxin-Lsp1a_1 n=1 Tax=Liphistius sp. SGP-2016 TaxID=1905180 RepID=A0A4Q8K1E1_9ARAC
MLLHVVFVVVLLAVSAKSDDELTDCQRHQQLMANSVNSPVTWNITCDSEGNYNDLQCTHQTPQWCRCFTKTGALASHPSRKIKKCDCYMKKYEAENTGATTCETPRCKTDGSFEPKQCCLTTNQCWCVNENGEQVGERTSGTLAC